MKLKLFIPIGLITLTALLFLGISRSYAGGTNPSTGCLSYENILSPTELHNCQETFVFATYQDAIDANFAVDEAQFGPTHLPQDIYYECGEVDTSEAYFQIQRYTSLGLETVVSCNNSTPYQNNKFTGEFHDDGETVYILKVKINMWNLTDVTYNRSLVKYTQVQDAPDDTCTSPYLNTLPNTGDWRAGVLNFGGDVDWYSLVIDQYSHVKLVLDVGTHNFDLAIVRQCPTLLYSATTQGSDRIIEANLSKGVYKLRVVGSTQQEQGQYNLNAMATPIQDTISPTITFAIPKGSQNTLQAWIQDSETGLKEISLNCKFFDPTNGELDVNIPAYAPGTTDPVVVTGWNRGMTQGKFECGAWARDMSLNERFRPFKGIVDGNQVMAIYSVYLPMSIR